MRNFFIASIKVYQYLLSPLWPNCCRFVPSCSQYAIDAVSLHGCFFGTLLTSYRLIRCNPFCKGGYDPVPNSLHFSPFKKKRVTHER